MQKKILRLRYAEANPTHLTMKISRSEFGKTCRVCGKDKLFDEFPKETRNLDGRAAGCKRCELDRQATWRRGAGKEKSAATVRRYQKTAKGRTALARARVTSVRRYRAKHPERRAAHAALGNAVQSGKIFRWPTCAIPECNAKPQAHHPDYSAPLDVVWLCPAHHKQAHALLKRAA